MNNDEQSTQAVDDSKTAVGSELNDMYGASSFDKDKIVLNSKIAKNINENDETRSEFLTGLNNYNEKPENAEHMAQALYKDNGKDIYGVKIEGVKGKTITRKDPETGRVLATESSFTGEKHLSSFNSNVSSSFRWTKKERDEAINNPQDTYGT